MKVPKVERETIACNEIFVDFWWIGEEETKENPVYKLQLLRNRDLITR
jgi:hypothetical protein